MYVFIKIPTTRWPSAIDHRKRSKFVYPYVYLPHDRTRRRARSHAGLRTRTRPLACVYLRRRWTREAQNYEVGGRRDEEAREGQEKTVASIRNGEFKASTPATTRL